MRTVDSRLAALCAILLAALVALWLLPGPVAHWRRWTPPEAQAPNLRDLESALLRPNTAASVRYPQVLERPLFSMNRRPVAEPAAASASPPPRAPIDAAKVLGIVAGPSLNGAMIEYDGKASFVRRGEELGGWKLVHVAGRTVRFERGTESRELKLPIGLMQGAATEAPQKPVAGNTPKPPPPPPAAPPGLPRPGAQSSSPPAPPQPAAATGAHQPASSSGVEAQFGG